MPVSTRKRPKVPGMSPGTPNSKRRADAYTALGVTESDAAAAPQITHILKELPATAPRAKDGGIARALVFLRGSAEPDAKKFLTVYDVLPPTTRHLLPIEAYCIAAGLTTKRLLELVMGACFEQSTATVALLARANHPKVVAATVKSALSVRHGFKDREALHKHAGFLPMPKTNILNVGGDWNQDNRKQISVGELGRIEDTQALIANRFNERLGLGSSEVKQIEGGPVEDVEPREPTPDPTDADADLEPEWVP